MRHYFTSYFFKCFVKSESYADKTTNRLCLAKEKNDH